jgi:hypothetical protein
MRISPLERLKAKGDLFDTREGSRLMYICIPLLVNQNLDVDTLSADNITSGNGLGRVDAEWRIYAIRAHFRNVDNSLITFGHVPPGVEIGDALVNFGNRDLAAITQASGNDDSYILIDDDTYHLVSVVPTGLGKNEEFCFDARRFSPKFRANGY